MEKNVSIRNWAKDDRPREKMIEKGAAALSDAELLAILISSGTPAKSALELGREILVLANNNLHELGRLSLKQLQQVKGIGEARAISISAALEIGNRRQARIATERAAFNSSSDAAEMLLPVLCDLNHEEFYVLYLNQSKKLLRTEKISSGGITGTVADVRMILKSALLYNANQIIVAHNHPSGSLTPSYADKVLTQKIKESALVMDILLLDHIIIAGRSFLSMADEGML